MNDKVSEVKTFIINTNSAMTKLKPDQKRYQKLRKISLKILWVLCAVTVLDIILMNTNVIPSMTQTFKHLFNPLIFIYFAFLTVSSLNEDRMPYFHKCVKLARTQAEKIQLNDRDQHENLYFLLVFSFIAKKSDQAIEILEQNKDYDTASAKLVELLSNDIDEIIEKPDKLDQNQAKLAVK